MSYDKPNFKNILLLNDVKLYTYVNNKLQQKNVENDFFYFPDHICSIVINSETGYLLGSEDEFKSTIFFIFKDNNPGQLGCATVYGNLDVCLDDSLYVEVFHFLW